MELETIKIKLASLSERSVKIINEISKRPGPDGYHFVYDVKGNTILVQHPPSEFRYSMGTHWYWTKLLVEDGNTKGVIRSCMDFIGYDITKMVKKLFPKNKFVQSNSCRNFEPIQIGSIDTSIAEIRCIYDVLRGRKHISRHYSAELLGRVSGATLTKKQIDERMLKKINKQVLKLKRQICDIDSRIEAEEARLARAKIEATDKKKELQKQIAVLEKSMKDIK